MGLPPSQYQASRQLDRICDLRVSISTGDYVDSDPWGRGKASGVRFPSRAIAERTLSSIQSSVATPPQVVNTAARRALRTSRIRQAAATRVAQNYQQPPQPPQHLQLRDSSRDSAPDVSAPPPQRTIAHVPSGFANDNTSSDKTSEPPSFANLRDLSMASTTAGRCSPASRRPRGGSNGSNGTGPPVKQAALADYLELSDEALVERVFDDDNEPVSAPGSGLVASVPQSPFNQNRIKRWIGKKSNQSIDSNSQSITPRSEGDSLRRKSSSKKVRDSLSRLLLLDAAPSKDDDHQPRTPPAPVSNKSVEAPSAASLEDETPPQTAVYEMVTLKTNIPDRPRASDSQPFDDALEFFDDVGDVAIGDAEVVDDYDDEVIVRSSGRVRPQLKEHMISSIKSYHGPDDYDDDDYADGEYSDDASTTTTEKSFTLNGKTQGNVLKSEAAFEESDISHSFSQPSNLQVSAP